MSEYWVSKKKYFCKYCDIYIADDAPSRQQHENGMRHKGNTERFIRGLYKGSEKRKKDADEEKRDMARVEQAAQAAFAQDVAAGLAKPSSASVPSTSAAPQKPIQKPSNPYANYSTAESLGYQDPDAEWYAAEAERHRTQGVAGDWEVISTSMPPSTTTVVDGSENDRSDGNLKREAETPVDEEDTRQFKLRKKTVTVGEIYDPGMIPIKTKKKEEPAEPVLTIPDPRPSLVTSNATNAPKWTTVQWKRPGEIMQEANIEEMPILVEQQQAVKTPIVNKSEEATPAPSETSSSGSMFRKRKAPAGGSRGRRAL